ncbi:MAG: hypothetical protein NC402_06725 [Prevotella sp.]|nr:hypothetical protein [Prevotella sp.]MCM1075431.1 hypothetical protein [Ruminococcus sp.]
MKTGKNRLIILLLAMLALVSTFARRQTLHINEKAMSAQKRVLGEASADSVFALSGDEAANAVRVFGYDKPHNATKESLFITNNLLSDTIISVTLTLKYSALNGAELHTRTIKESCLIAPGQTKRLQFASWDATRTFYYYRTPPRRKEGLSGYKVAVCVENVELRHTLSQSGFTVDSSSQNSSAQSSSVID